MFEGVTTISSVDVLCKEVASAGQPRPDLDLKLFQQTRFPNKWRSSIGATNVQVASKEG
jgi:chemotaxis receptor (MCP) glutamine deamidase CheD